MIEPPESAVYVSERGFSIRLPEGWERMEDSGSPALTINKAEVFYDRDNWSLCLTWMKSGFPPDEAAGREFDSLVTRAGALTRDEVARVIQRIFPLIGELDHWEVASTADERPALETSESFSGTEGTGLQRGYQLLFRSRHARRALFERLCFYAPAPEFDKNIESIRRAARSVQGR